MLSDWQVIYRSYTCQSYLDRLVCGGAGTVAVWLSGWPRLCCSDWLKSQFEVGGERGGDKGGVLYCVDAYTHTLLCVFVRECMHMVYRRNQNRAASWSADLQWQREKETTQRETEKTETTSGTGVTSANKKEAKFGVSAATLTTLITILQKAVNKGLWTTPDLSKMRSLLSKVFP